MNGGTSQTDKKAVSQKKLSDKIGIGFIRGLLLTLLLAIIAGNIAELPFFSIMGVMIISILLGIGWNSLMTVPPNAQAGIAFSSKLLLRAGIILMGLRLNLEQIISAGFQILLIDMIVVVFTIFAIYFLGKAFSMDRDFSLLLAVGTAICGAAAIVAVAPLIKAKKENTAIAVAFIAVFGTIGTIFYTFVYSFVDIDNYAYGVLVGSTLHELAHVVAASMPGGEVGSDIAILVKMGRVALLIPVATVIGTIFSNRKSSSKPTGMRGLPIPWFIFGFLAMSLLNSTGIIPENIIEFFISVSVLLLSMAMAGLGLSINFKQFKQVGTNAIAVEAIGSILLALLGILLIFIFS